MRLKRHPLGEANYSTTSSEKPQSSDMGASESAAFPSLDGYLATELQAVIDAWPALPEAVKVGILAMVQTTRDRQ